MFEVNFTLIKALIELLQRKTFLDNISTIGFPYASSFFHHVIQDKETRPTGTICSVSARILVQKMMYVN